MRERREEQSQLREIKLRSFASTSQTLSHLPRDGIFSCVVLRGSLNVMAVPPSQCRFAEIVRRRSHVTEEGIGGAVVRARIDDISPAGIFTGYADAEEAPRRCCKRVDELVVEDSARLFRECRWDGAESQEEEEPESTCHRTKGTVPGWAGRRRALVERSRSWQEIPPTLGRPSVLVTSCAASHRSRSTRAAVRV